MKPELLNDLNSLFCLLTEFDVVQRVREHYAQYHNPAPPALLQEEINKLEKHINEAYKPKRTKEMKPYFVVNVCYLCREGITFHLDKTLNDIAGKIARSAGTYLAVQPHERDMQWEFDTKEEAEKVAEKMRELNLKMVEVHSSQDQ